MTKKLSGKNALVTGGARGIGAAIARGLAAEGAAVVINYANDDAQAARLVAEINAGGGRAAAVRANVTDQNDVSRLLRESAAAFGKLDVLVNNAGVFAMQPLGQITHADFTRVFELNVLGALLVTQAALEHFNDGGAIINTCSDVSRIAPPGMAIYSASKAALDSLTRTFSKELGGRKIRVNAINPGPIETENVRASGAVDDFRALGNSRSLGRVGLPEDVAPLAVFLASPDAAWITGESFFVTGGLG